LKQNAQLKGNLEVAMGSKFLVSFLPVFRGFRLSSAVYIHSTKSIYQLYRKKCPTSSAVFSAQSSYSEGWETVLVIPINHIPTFKKRTTPV
jgi:hypothetical protein